MIYLITARETRSVNDADQIARPGWSGSSDWTMTGAVDFRFGRILRHYSMADVRAGRVPWRYKNGKQRCFVTHRDHGTFAVQMSPRLLDVKVGA